MPFEPLWAVVLALASSVGYCASSIALRSDEHLGAALGNGLSDVEHVDLLITALASRASDANHAGIGELHQLSLELPAILVEPQSAIGGSLNEPKDSPVSRTHDT
jgi:hypothetical protein